MFRDILPVGIQFYGTTGDNQMVSKIGARAKEGVAFRMALFILLVLAVLVQIASDTRIFRSPEEFRRYVHGLSRFP